VIEGDAYQVRSGDTLWSIARLHEVSVDDLARANGIDLGATLRVGQELRIPVPAEEAGVDPKLKALIAALLAAAAADAALFGIAL
jgi:LysM repeat protein